MTGPTVPTIGAIVLQLVLGLAVFHANPKRRLNQCFLLLSLLIVAQLGSLYFGLTAPTSTVAEFSIRQASVAGALCLVMFNFLRLSLLQREQRRRKLNITRHNAPATEACLIENS